MPPKGGFKGGGGGGGFKGGGGWKGGHHHHHHPGGWQGGWGPGWYGPGYWGAAPGYSELIVTPQCPGVIEPVLATDGRVYNNDCEARAAGQVVVRRVDPKTLKDYVTTGDIIPGVPNLALAAGGAIAAYLLFFRKRR